MKKYTIQIFREISALAETIPANFKAFFAKSDGFWIKKSDGTIVRLATMNDSLPANGGTASYAYNAGNADTLDGQQADNFARINTAFTTWYNIPDNNPSVHIYVLNMYNHANLNNVISDLGSADLNPKVIILQPGTYEINNVIDLESKAVLGIIGCSREDTFIKSNKNSFFTNAIFLENISFEIKGEFSDTTAGTVVAAKKNVLETYIRNVSVKNTFTDNLNIVKAIDGFNSGNNIKISNFSNALYRCYNFSDVNIDVISTDETLADALINESKRLSNISINFNATGSVFKKCSEISNFRIIGGGLDKTLGFDACENINNGRIESLKYGLNHSKYINNVYVTLCIHGFYYSDKISTSIADANDSGFYTCNGLVSNRSTSNTNSQYDACYADMSSSYPVSDTYDGGWNA